MLRMFHLCRPLVILFRGPLHPSDVWRRVISTTAHQKIWAAKEKGPAQGRAKGLEVSPIE